MIEALKDTARVRILSDSPTERAHHFGFSVYAETFAKIIADRSNRTPLTIAINGAWGSGKTSLMRSVRQMLRDITEDVERVGTDDVFRPCRTVWFNAWKYSGQDAILVALVEEIVTQLMTESFPRQRLEKVRMSDGGLDWSRISRSMDDLVRQAGTPDLKGMLTSDTSLLRNLPLLREFERFLERLIAWTITGNDSSRGDFRDTDGALVFFIDDLDRCQPDRVARVLETVKLFMDRTGCVFVIGMDSEIVEKAVKAEYLAIEGFDEHAYMDKIIQLQFNLPPIRPEHIQGFIREDLVEGRPEESPILRYLETVAETVAANPRTVKRFMNTFAIQRSLAERRGFLRDGLMDEDLLAKWIIISFSFERFSERALQRPLLIAEVQDIIRSETDDAEAPSEEGEMVYPPHLREFLEDQRLVNLLKGGKPFPSSEEEISIYTHLSVSTAPRRAPSEEFRLSRAAGTEGTVPVGRGKFLMGELNKTVFLEGFEIDMYPVTNRQYQRFRDATGHSGVPDHWRDGAYPAGLADHPVVNVSHADCVAYAEWAGRRLPTEQEWEKAARGPNGRIYPWGNTFHRENCNSQELGRHDTTDVTEFPNGASQYGVFDMVGNVWEWTATNVFPDKEDAKVLRGGSWANPREGVRTTTRAYERSERKRRDVGFRCVRDVNGEAT